MTKLSYILAASHSGSTLLSMLLGTHPRIATIGEMKLSARSMGNLDCYRCSCGNLIRECAFWQKIKNGMTDRGFSLDLAAAGTDYREVESGYARRLLAATHRGGFLEHVRDVALSVSPVWRSQLSCIHRRNAALAATVARIAGAKVVVDSSKNPVRLKYLLRNSELDVKVIRLLRDGRAVALTAMDTAAYADASDPALRGGGGGSSNNERLSMFEAAHRWRRSIEEAEHVLARMDRSRLIEVRYEDYCCDPDGTLDRLHRFLGVEPVRRPQEFRSIEQHVVGNGMRLDTTSEIRLDERWRDVLNEDHLRIFDGIAGAMNRRYGYV